MGPKEPAEAEQGRQPEKPPQVVGSPEGAKQPEAESSMATEPEKVIMLEAPSDAGRPEDAMDPEEVGELERATDPEEAAEPGALSPAKAMDPEKVPEPEDVLPAETETDAPSEQAARQPIVPALRRSSPSSENRVRAGSTAPGGPSTSRRGGASPLVEPNVFDAAFRVLQDLRDALNA